jgi:hypothetical protein
VKEETKVDKFNINRDSEDDFELEETTLPFENEVDEYIDDDEEDHSSDDILEEE